MADLIRQHKDVQQQIADAKQRAAKLELVANLEKKQAHFEACLSAGVHFLPCCKSASSYSMLNLHNSHVCMHAYFQCFWL